MSQNQPQGVADVDPPAGAIEEVEVRGEPTDPATVKTLRRIVKAHRPRG